MLTADRDARVERDVDAAGGGEELDRAGVDLLGDVVRTLLVRGCRGARSRRLVVLDGVLELSSTARVTPLRDGRRAAPRGRAA